MANNLKLITTENFGELACDFYRNMNDDILLTREQIGKALGYSNPQKAIQKIHLSHKDRLDNLCVRITENRHPQNGGVGVAVETVYYSQRGVMEICRWSRQPKANEFMDWVWDIIEAYRDQELTSQIDFNKLTEIIATAISESITAAIAPLYTILNTMQQNIDERLTKLEQSHTNRYLAEKRYPSAWYKKMKTKYELLMEYFGVTRRELYSNIYKELEDTYDIDINQVHEDYCYDNNLLKDECYPMDAIEHNKKIRDALTTLIDSSLVKYGLQTPEQINHYKRKTIFDEEPMSTDESMSEDKASISLVSSK